MSAVKILIGNNEGSIVVTTVVQRIREIKQPRGGFLTKNDFEKIMLNNDNKEIFNFDEENIHGRYLGITVDYITRFMLSDMSEFENFIRAFYGALMGTRSSKENIPKELVKTVFNNPLSDDGIINAIRISHYDQLYRSPLARLDFNSFKEINPNYSTINNVRSFVNRSLYVFEQYGPIVMDGFEFPEGYTEFVTIGEADYLTNDSLFDLKLLRGDLNKNYTMQIMMYWRMGLRAHKKKFENVRYLRFYNPRKDILYQIDVDNISEEIIRIVDKDVIGYTDYL